MNPGHLDHRPVSTGTSQDYAAGRWRVSESVSPNSDRYAPAKRPKCQKPYPEAISVTVAAPAAVSRRARRTSRMQRSSRDCLGPMPRCS